MLLRQPTLLRYQQIHSPSSPSGPTNTDKDVLGNRGGDRHHDMIVLAWIGDEFDGMERLIRLEGSRYDSRIRDPAQSAEREAAVLVGDGDKIPDVPCGVGGGRLQPDEGAWNTRPIHILDRPLQDQPLFEHNIVNEISGL